MRQQTPIIVGFAATLVFFGAGALKGSESIAWIDCAFGPLPNREIARWDEGHLLALPDRFVLHPDSQHGHTKMFLLPARADGQVSSLWSPPHPRATTYQSAMSHAWADG